MKTPIQQAGSTQQQAYFYNGWKHNHFVTSVFCFCPDGTIPITYMNLPGSMHDSMIVEWGRIYDKLESLYETMGAITCVDSAFLMKNSPYIIKSSQENCIGVGDSEVSGHINEAIIRMGDKSITVIVSKTVRSHGI